MTSLIITFRETLEAALVVGIILGFLSKTNQKRLNVFVWFGVAAGIIASIIGAVLFNVIAGGFEGKAEEIFEGIAMLLGAVLLTTLIFWMMKNSNIKKEIEEKAGKSIGQFGKWGIFSLVFISILREGIETVIFLKTAAISSSGINVIWAVLGIIIALILAVLLFFGLIKVNLKIFFTVTNILLLLFAAGLVAHGIHELQEAEIIPIVIEHVWDINPKLNADGSFPLLHEKGNIGSIFKGLLGYNGNPSLIEVFSYLLYLLSIISVWIFITIKKKK